MPYKTLQPPSNPLKAPCDPLGASQPPPTQLLPAPSSGGGCLGKACGRKHPLPSHAPSPTSSAFLLGVSCLITSPAANPVSLAEPCRGDRDGQMDGRHFSPHLSRPHYTSPSHITLGCEAEGKHFSGSRPHQRPAQCYPRPGRVLLPCLSGSRIQPHFSAGCQECAGSRVSRGCLGLPGGWELPAPRRTSPRAWGRAGSIPGTSQAHLGLG